MSNRAAPQVVTGTRGPVDRGGVTPAAESELAKKVAAVAGLATQPAVKPGEVVFQSRAFAYRYQLTAPADRLDPATGVLVRARPRNAQFHQGLYRTSDEADIKRMKSDPAYGVGRDFWDAEEMRKAALDRQVASLTASVAASGDQAMIERVVADLLPLIGKKDFDLGQPPKVEEQPDGK